MGQERILLRLVEPVNLIDEQNRALSKPPGLFRHGHDVLDLFYSRKNCAEENEGRLGHVGDDLSQRGLSDSRRSPKDHGGNLVSLNRGAEGFSRTKKMILTQHFI